jgi:hypothetical protein
MTSVSTHTGTETSSKLDTVLTHLDRAWSTIPLTPHGKQPLIAWREFQERRATDTEARAWWAQWPEANVGVVTGAISGLVVLDVDPRHGGDVALAQLVATHGALPRTVEARTGGGGRHVLFAYPGIPVRSRAGQLGPGLDVRGDGGYVVVPPSVHPSGVPYAWVNPPDAADLAPLPAWLRARVVEPAAVAPAAGSPNADSRHTPVREGQRNTHLTSLPSTPRTPRAVTRPFPGAKSTPSWRVSPGTHLPRSTR